MAASSADPPESQHPHGDRSADCYDLLVVLRACDMVLFKCPWCVPLLHPMIKRNQWMPTHG